MLHCFLAIILNSSKIAVYQIILANNAVSSGNQLHIREYDSSCGAFILYLL